MIHSIGCVGKQHCCLGDDVCSESRKNKTRGAWQKRWVTVARNGDGDG